MAKYVILGAGMTGLNIAYNLKKDYFLAEKSKKVGGLAGSIERNGFLFDYAEHFLRIPNKSTEDFIIKLMREKIFSQELISAIYFKEKFIPYPFQENIRELPISELKKCAKSMILNYFLRNKNKKEFSNFEEFIYYQYGDYIAKEFMIPYNEKIWLMKTKEMNTSWFLGSKFISTFDLDDIINVIFPLSRVTPKSKNIRWYPVEGGSQELANAYIPHLNHLALNNNAIEIDIEKKKVLFNNGHSESYEKLISTIPLPELINIIDKTPKDIDELSSNLKFNSVYCLNICVNREKDYKYHWIYFPQRDVPFSRLFFSSSFSKHNVPKGKSSCSALITFPPDSDFNTNSFERNAIQSLIELGFLKDDSDIIDKIPLTIKYGYTLPTIELSEQLRTIQDFLTNHEINSIGRYGEWKYAGIEHAIEDGQRIVLKLNKR